jgi:hypothetical protein
MATKKAAKQKKAKLKGQSYRKPLEDEVLPPPATDVQQVSENDEAAPRVPGVMSGIEIGHVAGEVWGVLSRGEPVTLAALKKEVMAPGDLVIAAIGWLAREDKIDFSTAGRTVRLSLR